MTDVRENRLQAVLFDLDGVVVDTAKYHYEAWKSIADEEGIYFDAVINERLKGVSRMESLSIIMERSPRKYADEELKLLAERKNNVYVSLLKSLTPGDVLPGIKNFIGELKENGIKTAICSASKNAPAILDKLGTAQLFDIVISGNDTTRSKPDPEVFLMAAEKLLISADGCLVIEDSAAGIEAAMTGGMKSIGIGENDRLFNADRVIASTEGLSYKMVEILFNKENTHESHYDYV